MLNSVSSPATNTTANALQIHEASLEVQKFNGGIDRWVSENPQAREDAAICIKKAYLNSETQLDIYVLQLDSLPKEIGQLTALKKLNLHDAGHIRRLPESIQQLVNLECLVLGEGFLLIPENIAQLPKLSTLVLSYAHNLLFKPDLPANVWIQGGYEVPSFSNFVAEKKISLLDFFNEQDIQKFQSLVDYAENKIDNNEFIDQLREKAKTLPENWALKEQVRQLGLNAAPETLEPSQEINLAHIALNRLSFGESAATKKESEVALFIASLKNQTEEVELSKVLDSKVALQIIFKNASLEELSALVKIIVDSKLSESAKGKTLETYTFTSKPEKNSAFREAILASDLDEFTKAKLLPDLGVTIKTTVAPANFKLDGSIISLAEIKARLQNQLNSSPLLAWNDVTVIKAFVNASHAIFPDRNIEYCEDTKEIADFIEKFKDPEQYSATEAHIVASSGGHRYLLDLHRHTNGEVTALAIDPVGVYPHYESHNQYRSYAPLFGENKSTFISTRVLSANQGCTIFSAHFALCADRNKQHFSRLHQQLLEGIEPQRKDLPLAMFKHIQSSKQIDELKKEGLDGIESIALRRSHFGKEDSSNSIAYQRRDYKELALQYWNTFEV